MWIKQYFDVLKLYFCIMNRKKYHKGNFFKHTYCVFDERSFDEIKDTKHNYVSQSGSKYIFLPDGLYRISNHWGRVANCRWRLNTLDKKSQVEKLGYASWDSFYPNDENFNIFYIAFDEVSNTYTFKHKFETNENSNLIFRNASQTAKVLKDLKEVCETTAWAKHLQYEDYELLKQKVIYDLIHSTKSFLEIKRNYL